MGNLPGDDEYTFGPDDLSWFSVFGFDPAGYVRDDETVDPDALLQALKKGNVRSNEERGRRNIPLLYPNPTKHQHTSGNRLFLR
jgi:uncharacterized membrane-anchored protein